MQLLPDNGRKEKEQCCYSTACWSEVEVCQCFASLPPHRAVTADAVTFIPPCIVAPISKYYYFVLQYTELSNVVIIPISITCVQHTCNTSDYPKALAYTQYKSIVCQHKDNYYCTIFYY